MLILEMSGSVDGCSLSKAVQRLIDNNTSITNDKPLTRMVLCGSTGSTVPTLLASNLTWVASEQPNSTVCQPSSTLVKCEANETLAVLLTDTCPPEPSTTTTGIFPTTTGTSEANRHTNTTTDNTTAAQQKNATQGIAQTHYNHCISAGQPNHKSHHIECDPQHHIICK
ncbi:uncharacterized protein LOC133933040 [Platichthys flesus]|uniref:uncharacterized protein LOC133933040 n=1 Tax=Platichthys flesus TaxID=8260 RepID=UPI002DBEC204|nr:uncharacterized protein LOC133933040 [Platichthys flesus]